MRAPNWRARPAAEKAGGFPVWKSRMFDGGYYMRRVSTNCWPPELVQLSWLGVTNAQFTLLVVWRISERIVISTLRASAMR